MPDHPMPDHPMSDQPIPDPISDKQLAANRTNAAHSTGPRTPEGKSRSAQNARKHGFTASSYNVLRLESFDGIAGLKHALLARYRPVDAQELFAVEPEDVVTGGGEAVFARVLSGAGFAFGGAGTGGM